MNVNKPPKIKQNKKQKPEDILYHNYGPEAALNDNGAAAWIRIKQHKLYDLQQIDCIRNVWILPTFDSINLSRFSAELSCLSCDNGKNEFSCAWCKGKGNSREPCSKCLGSGIINYRKCHACEGKGGFKCPVDCKKGEILIACQLCDGSGCSDCNGKGPFWIECPGCKGDWQKKDCHRCNGTGDYNWRNSGRCNHCCGNGFFQYKCKKCYGTGKFRCPSCNGNHYIRL